MPALAELLCVAPQFVPSLWPRVRDDIKTAMERGDLGDFATVERSVIEGDALLWIAADGGTVIASAVTDLSINNGRKVCTIVACGGRDWRRFGHLIAGIESYAKAEGCGCVRLMGRKGWARLLHDYRADKIVLEKAL